MTEREIRKIIEELKRINSYCSEDKEENQENTRGDEFKKKYPNCIQVDGQISVNPCLLDTSLFDKDKCLLGLLCDKCREHYWNGEVEK